MIIRSAAGLADTKIHEPTAMVGQTSCALIESGRSRSATDLSANRFFACFSCSRLHSISCYKPLLNNLKHAQRSFSVVGVQRVRIPPSPPAFAPSVLRMERQDEEPPMPSLRPGLLPMREPRRFLARDLRSGGTGRALAWPRSSPVSPARRVSPHGRDALLG